MLPLHVRRVVADWLLASTNSALRGRPTLSLLRPLLTSAAPSRRVATPVAKVCLGRLASAERQTSQVKLLSLSLGPRRIYPATLPGEYWASASIAALPSVAGLVSGFCSSSPSFGIGSLQIPPRDGHPGLASRFRSPRPAENLHLRDSKHAWQTKKPRSRPGLFVLRKLQRGFQCVIHFLHERMR